MIKILENEIDNCVSKIIYIVEGLKFMKKKIGLFIIIAVVGIGSVFYILFNSIFPVANSAEYPNQKDINSFSALYDNETIELSDMSLGGILVYIKTAEPTRKMSVNDRPSTRPYFEIVVDTEAQQYNYFIYEESNKIYLEIPYYGIYTIDKDILEDLCILELVQERKKLDSGNRHQLSDVKAMLAL